jgi:hypothetical protein
VFHERSASDRQVLKIAGFFEMTRPERPSGSPGSFTQLKRIFETLDYDLGVLDADVARHMRETGDGPPQGWMSVASQAHCKIFPVNGSKVGFLVFPPSPDQPDFSRITALAQKMGSNLSLLVGISPWGAGKERKFLRETPGALDILLGGGPGPSFKAKYPGAGRTIWIRPYSEGKAIHSIRLSGLDSRAPQEPWKPRKNCTIRLIMLKESISQKPSIEEIIR